VNRFWNVFWFELKRQGRRRAYLFTTFGIPLIAIVLLLDYQVIRGLDLGGGEETPPQEDTSQADEVRPVGYVDHSGLFPSPGLFRTSLIRFDSEDAARAAVEADEIGSFYVIEEDYVETGAVEWYAPQLDINGENTNSFFANFLMQTMLQGMDRRLLYRLQDPLNIVEHRVAIGGEVSQARSEGTSMLLIYLFSFLLLFGAFFSSGYLMQSVIEEKETRMVEILLSTMRPPALLAGKVLSLGLLGLFQLGVWLAVAVFLLNRAGAIIPELANVTVHPETLFWMVLYFIFGYLLFAGVYAAIGAVAPSMREGPQLAVFITLPAAIPFYFSSTVFLESPNGPLATLLSLFPITAPLSMAQRIAIVQVPLVELIVSVALLALSAAGAIWLAGRFFRVNALLAGQMPKWRDLGRILRES